MTKSFLLTISVLLFLHPSISLSSDEVTLYKWKTSEGYKWKKFGEEETHEKYEGEVNWSGVPDGVGTFTLNYSSIKYSERKLSVFLKELPV